MGIQGIERLAFGVDADVRVVLQHAMGELADRFEHVIGDAHPGQFVITVCRRS
jgi:hypothetical protein